MKLRLIHTVSAFSLLFLIACTHRHPAATIASATPEQTVKVTVPAASETTQTTETFSATVTDRASGTSGDTVPAKDCGQTEMENRTLTPPYTINDTTFLYRCTRTQQGEPEYIKAYVVRDRLAPKFEELRSSLRFDDRMYDPLESELCELRTKFPGPLPVHDVGILCGAWAPLSRLHGKYYVNELDLYPFWIADSLLIRSTIEGLDPVRIRRLERLSPKHFFLVGDFSYPEQPECVDIHIIDPVRKIALFRFRGPIEYDGLYGAADRIDQFDLVVWEMNELPGPDPIAWDEIDYEAMIPENERTLPDLKQLLEITEK